ncbi:ParB/RepB/Spo0J family partition protein [Longimicrobium sp.]|uniref:ParB/RepB/Spo0J family partition protein n=1 Tax=Longimicrobium sp. TaxID=2029185 RepID=UPI002E35CF66|nr:ParB N-terminal domain-containing protein [Longimicrobium sp.]HEX6037929.1 ParB N-terminal domain-containing protein [Longimicrobium sp.]
MHTTLPLADPRVQHVRLDCIDPSPYQVRLVFPEGEIDALADSILATGLIHEPRGRPHPTRAGRVELMPGEMRVRALERLVQRGQADGVLQRDQDGQWLVPVVLAAADDDHAERMVASENADRSDLSPWEWARAYAARRERRRERGLGAGVRDVAGSAGSGKKFQTVGEYLQVADALTMEVLLAAGVVKEGQPDHARLARLPLAALRRVARAAGASATAAAERLLQELVRAGDVIAAERLAKRERVLQPPAEPWEAGFQVNIRQPLTSLASNQAARYLSRLAPVVEVLAGRAELDTGEGERIAAILEAAARAVRAGGPGRARLGTRAARRRTALAQRNRGSRAVQQGLPLRFAADRRDA